MVFSDSIKGQSYLYCRAIAAIEGPKGERKGGGDWLEGKALIWAMKNCVWSLSLFLFPPPGRGAVGHVSETRTEKVI